MHVKMSKVKLEEEAHEWNMVLKPDNYMSPAECKLKSGRAEKAKDEDMIAGSSVIDKMKD